MSKRKYERGAPFEDVASAVAAILNNEYIYENHKILHFGWAVNWPLRQIRIAVSGRRLFRAIKIEEPSK